MGFCRFECGGIVTWSVSGLGCFVLGWLQLPFCGLRVLGLCY